MGENVAIFGITGALGREIQVALESEQEGIARFFPVAGVASAGSTVSWRGSSLPVLGSAAVNPADVDVAVFACRPNTVRREAPRFVSAGTRIIDASGTLARLPVPQGVPSDAVVGWPRLAAGIAPLAEAMLVALPDATASTAAPLIEAMTIAAQHNVGLLPPLASIDFVVLKTASAAGRHGIEALSTQAVKLLNYQSILDPAPFDTTLAFNLYAPPPEDVLVDEAHTTAALRALLPALGHVPVNLTTVFAGAFSGLCVVATLRFATTPSIVAVEKAIGAHPDLEVADTTPELDIDEDEIDGLTVGGQLPTVAGDDDNDDGPASLRDTLDSDCVRYQKPTLGPDGAVRIVLFADPLHRTAVACQSLISAWIDEDA